MVWIQSPSTPTIIPVCTQSVWVFTLSGGVAGDDGDRAGFRDKRSEVFAIVGLVGNYVARPEVLQQGRGLRSVAPLPRCEYHPPGPPLGISGEMEIKSVVGKGTTVTVTFPNGAP